MSSEFPHKTDKSRAKPSTQNTDQHPFDESGFNRLAQLGAMRSLTTDQMLYLQRTMGNQAVLKLIASNPQGSQKSVAQMLQSSLSSHTDHLVQRKKVQTSDGLKEIVDLTLAEAQTVKTRTNPFDPIYKELEEHIKFFDVRDAFKTGDTKGALHLLVNSYPELNKALKRSISLEATDDYSSYFTDQEKQNPSTAAELHQMANADGLTRSAAEMSAVRGGQQQTTVIVKLSKMRSWILEPLGIGTLINTLLHELVHAEQIENGTISALGDMKEYEAYMHELKTIRGHLKKAFYDPNGPDTIFDVARFNTLYNDGEPVNTNLQYPPLPKPSAVEHAARNASKIYDNEQQGLRRAGPPDPWAYFKEMVDALEYAWSGSSQEADQLSKKLLEAENHKWLDSLLQRRPPELTKDNLQQMLQDYKLADKVEEVVFHLFSDLGRGGVARERLSIFEQRIKRLETQIRTFK